MKTILVEFYIIDHDDICDRCPECGALARFDIVLNQTGYMYRVRCSECFEYEQTRWYSDMTMAWEKWNKLCRIEINKFI